MCVCVGGAAISWALGCISVDNRHGEEAREVSVSSSASGQGRVTVQNAIMAIVGQSRFLSLKAGRRDETEITVNPFSST